MSRTSRTLPPFEPGVQLCQAFYTEAVRPLLDAAFPGLPHAAARVGPGSDVLGFDTVRSVDHDWGPQLQLFLTAEDLVRHSSRLSRLLSEHLPRQVRGWPTSFEPAGAPVRSMSATDGPVAHGVQITDVSSWATDLLGFDPAAGVNVGDWLSTPTQRLAEVTGGVVFQDDVGQLTRLRSRLSWYPGPVWRYVLAAQWTRIAQEEAFVGRAAEVGDELGSRLVAGRLARDVMRLCLLLARRYPPYTKWLGTACSQVPAAAPVIRAVTAAVVTDDAVVRQDELCAAYELVGRWQNELGLAAHVDPARRAYFDRPFPVVDGTRFAAALLQDAEDEALAVMPSVGAVDQFVDSTDVLCRPALARALTQAVTVYQ